MEEKINQIYKNNSKEIVDMYYGEKEIMIDIFKTLEKHNIKSYKDIIKKLKEASDLASMITTL